MCRRDPHPELPTIKQETADAFLATILHQRTLAKLGYPELGELARTAGDALAELHVALSQLTREPR